MKMTESKQFEAVPQAAMELINDIPVDFFGRLILIYEAGKIRRVEKQQSFHIDTKRDK